jgi:drug/metabolite transporter (DMT)-like permease
LPPFSDDLSFENMLPFVFWIALTAGLFVIFQYFTRYQVKVFEAIVVNYWVCVVVGTVFMQLGLMEIADVRQNPNFIKLLLTASGLGGLFISGFYLTALATQRAGVSAASLASRISFAIPLVAGYFILGKTINFNYLNIIGLFLAFVSVLLGSYKPSQKERQNALLPFFVFLMTGTIDTLFNTASELWLRKGEESLFTTMVFGSAAILGTTFLLFQKLKNKEKFARKNLIAGLILGVPNFFSVLLLLVVLRLFDNNGAFVFPIFNIGVIVSATLLSIVFFNEELFWWNKAGILAAVLAVLLISYQTWEI